MRPAASVPEVNELTFILMYVPSAITIGPPDVSVPTVPPTLVNEPIRLDSPFGRVSELEWIILLNDIDLVAHQTRVSHKRAALSYILNSFDLVNAIMELTI